MYNDDFNNVKISNEKDGFSSPEFGNIQNTEFTFFNDNKAKSNTELNEKDDTSEKSNDESSSEESKLVQQNKVDSNLISQTTTTTSAATSAATSASAGGVIASASAVTVATVSTIVGVNVIMSTKCNVNNLDVTPVSVIYDLDINESNDDLVVINLENKDNNFITTQDLNEGKNTGSFEGLLPSCEYTLTVVDKKYDNVILERKVTTLDLYDMKIDINPEVYYSDTSFNVKLGFSGDYSLISDIYLYMSNEFKGTKKFPLIANNETQKIILNDENDKVLFSFFDDFDYYVSYVYKNKTFNTDTNKFKFKLERPINTSFKLNNFNVEYVEKENKVISFKVDITDPDNYYSNPRIKLNKVDISGGVSTLNPTEVATLPLDKTDKGAQRLTFSSLDINEKFYQYQLVLFDNIDFKDVVIDSKVFNLDHKIRQGLIDVSLNPKYYTLNNVPILPLNLHLRDYDKVFEKIIFRYKLEGEESYKESFRLFSPTRQGTISMRLDLNGQTPEEVTIESYQIIPVNHQSIELQPLYICDTPTTLTKSNEPEIFGANIENRISLNKPELIISCTNNFTNSNEIKNMELYFADANPPTFFYSKYNFPIRLNYNPISETLYEIDNSANFSLNDPAQLQDDPDKYNNLIEYIKTMPVVIMLSYTINNVEKDIILSSMIYFDLY